MVRVDPLIDEAGLAHPGLPDHRHHLPVADLRLREGLDEGGHFRVTADEARQAPRHPGLKAPAQRRRPDELEDRDGLWQPLHGDWPQGRDLHQPLHQPQGVGRQQNAPRGGELFHAGREMRRLAYGGVIHVQIIADRPHHDGAGVQAHAHLHANTMGAACLLGIGPDGSVHRESRIAGAQGMVFMRQRGPEQGHNAIAHDLIHRPLIAVHRRHHPLQHGIEELPGLLRIAVGQQFHGAPEVSEEDRNLLALAFQGAAGGEDFLREIGRGVGKGGGGLVEWGRGTRGDSSGPSRPNQHLAFLVPSKLVHLHNFVREECEQVVVELKLDLERTIGDTAMPP